MNSNLPPHSTPIHFRIPCAQPTSLLLRRRMCVDMPCVWWLSREKRPQVHRNPNNSHGFWQKSSPKIWLERRWVNGMQCKLIVGNKFLINHSIVSYFFSSNVLPAIVADITVRMWLLKMKARELARIPTVSQSQLKRPWSSTAPA